VTIPIAGRGVARAPGVALVVCYVLLAANQVVADLVVKSFPGPGFPLYSVVMFPSWRVSPRPGNEWNFWAMDLRAVLFVALMVFGLRRLARSSPGGGAFVALVGTTVLAASVAAVAGALLTVAIAGQPNAGNDWDYAGSDSFENLLMIPLIDATLFGLVFGIALGAVAARAYRSPGPDRPDNQPPSLW
jgi:hypothetical protein